MSQTVLFIGGPHDGERVAVADGELRPFMRLAMALPYDLARMADEKPEMVSFMESVYRLEFLGTGHMKTTPVYVHHSMTIHDAAVALIGRYPPPRDVGGLTRMPVGKPFTAAQERCPHRAVEFVPAAGNESSFSRCAYCQAEFRVLNAKPEETR